MVVIAVFALIDAETSGHMMVILGDASGELCLFAGIVANFMSITDPAAFWLVNLVLMFILRHIFLLYHTFAKKANLQVNETKTYP